MMCIYKSKLFLNTVVTASGFLKLWILDRFTHLGNSF